ncbi:type II secretion system protein [Massilia sp. Dwa41.01b]|uniref:type II secretion system protein n=1 Tax=unclassified Massilia TaxID=2609279 RepID=UPI0015FF2979|nr:MULTISPECIES: type II secretion system protein [unclassified Massilia]QNA88883.1 type II secretion system protein [Massilia sp. Dwa41.01b]QNA99775.1 type II secretion system protein [Massilia sp. Se16.2.3]
MSTESTVRAAAPGPWRQAGVTMVELIMFMVIIGIALAGIIRVITMTTANSADPLVRKQALMIAEGLLEEVRLAQFTYCDPTSAQADTATSAADCTAGKELWGREAGTSAVRPYDNVNDYVTEPNTPQASFNFNNVLTDAAGRAIDVRGYSATVSIIPAAIGAGGIAAANAAGAADADALRIRITVSGPSGDPVVLDGYRARYAPNFR